MKQFGLHGLGHRHSLEAGWQKVDLINQQQIIERSGVSDHSQHSQAEPCQIGAVVLEIFHAEVVVNASRLEESIQLIARLEAQYTLQLGKRETPCPMFLDGKSFKRPAFDVATLRDKAQGEFVGDLNRDVHFPIVAKHRPGDKYI